MKLINLYNFCIYNIFERWTVSIKLISFRKQWFLESNFILEVLLTMPNFNLDVFGYRHFFNNFLYCCLLLLISIPGRTRFENNRNSFTYYRYKKVFHSFISFVVFSILPCTFVQCSWKIALKFLFWNSFQSNLFSQKQTNPRLQTVFHLFFIFHMSHWRWVINYVPTLKVSHPSMSLPYVVDNSLKIIDRCTFIIDLQIQVIHWGWITCKKLTK